MTYFEYLFSDKKAKIYWILLFVLLAMYSIFMSVLTHDIRACIMMSVFPAIFIKFYTSGFLNYKKQQKFLKIFSNNIKQESIRQQNVQMFFDSFTMMTFKGNWEAKINLKPKSDKFTVLFIDNKIGILGHSYEFGTFRFHMKPIVISLKENDMVNKYKYAKTLQISNLEKTDNDLEITFKKRISNIKKLKLIGWYENKHPL